MRNNKRATTKVNSCVIKKERRNLYVFCRRKKAFSLFASIQSGASVYTYAADALHNYGHQRIKMKRKKHVEIIRWMCRGAVPCARASGALGEEELEMTWITSVSFLRLFTNEGRKTELDIEYASRKNVAALGPLSLRLSPARTRTQPKIALCIKSEKRRTEEKTQKKRRKKHI